MMSRSIQDLFDHFGEISDYCQKTMEPVLLKDDENEDLVAMSVDAYKEMLVSFVAEDNEM